MTTPAPDSNLASYNVLAFINYDLLYQVGTGIIRYDFKWSLGEFGTYAVKDTGTKYDGLYSNVAGNIRLDSSFGNATNGEVVFPKFTITLNRNIVGQNGLTPTDLETIRKYQYLLGKTIEVFRVDSDSPNPDSTTQVFEGIISRGDIRIDEATVQITATDRMKMDDRLLLRDEVATTDVLDPAWRGKKMPLIFGDWSDAGSKYYIPAIVMNSQNGSSEILVKVSDQSDYGRYQNPTKAKWVDDNWQEKGGGTNASNPAALSALPFPAVGYLLDDTDGTTFYNNCATGIQDTEDTSYWLWKEDDKILFNSVKGLKDSSGDLLEHPVDIVEYLLTSDENGLSVASADINAASFTSAKNDTPDYVARAWIDDEEMSVLGCIENICKSFGYKIVVKNGLYYIYHIGYHDISTVTHTVTHDQIKDWDELLDEEKEGFSVVQLSYRHNPSRDELEQEMARPSYPDAPNTEIHKLDSKWIAHDDTAGAVVGNLVVALGGALRTVIVKLDFSALDITLGDTVQLDTENDPTKAHLHDKYQVTKCVVDYDSAEITLTLTTKNQCGLCCPWADDAGGTVPAEWGGGTVPAAPYGYSTFTAAQQELLGFWINCAYDPATCPTGSDFNEDGTTPGKRWCGDVMPYTNTNWGSG